MLKDNFSNDRGFLLFVLIYKYTILCPTYKTLKKTYNTVSNSDSEFYNFFFFLVPYLDLPCFRSVTP